jgi:hypothetical protein
MSIWLATVYRIKQSVPTLKAITPWIAFGLSGGAGAKVVGAIQHAKDSPKSRKYPRRSKTDVINPGSIRDASQIPTIH